MAKIVPTQKQREAFRIADEFVLMLKKELDNGTTKRALARKYKVDRNIFKRKILCQ